MTDECIILSDNGIQKARSLHRVTPKEKFLISEFEKAPEFLWNDVAENLKSAIETRQDQGSSGHRRMRLTIEIAMRIGVTPGCSGCAGSRSHTEACREEHWLMRKRARVRERSEQELDQLQKMTVELQQPTVVMQQEPSPSPFSSPTVQMQEPTQDIQNELMDSPMEMGAQEHREQGKVRLNETLSSEMSRRPVVKAKSAHPSMIAPMMWDRLFSLTQHHPARTRRQQAVCTRLTESTL